MIGVFVDQNVGEQARTGASTLNGAGWQGRLGEKRMTDLLRSNYSPK